MLQVAPEVMTRVPSGARYPENNDPLIRHHLLNLLESQQSAELMTVDGKQALQAAIHEPLNIQLKELNEPGTIKGGSSPTRCSNHGLL